MFAELRGIIAGIGNTHLRALLKLIFEDEELASLYKVAPAAKSIHHACRGGLLEHVLSLCALGKMTAAHYPEVDPDLLVAGVILHDIGKVEELSYARSFGYSSEGQLLGHIVLGLRLLSGKFVHLPGFPHKLRTLLEHMIVSHHGELEFGSPKVPLFAEALLLHHLDNLDSKMNAMRSVLRRDPHSEGEFTGWVASLERVLLRKDRYLNVDQPPPPVAPEQSAPSSDVPQAPDINVGQALPPVAPKTFQTAPPHPIPSHPQPPPPERKPEPHRLPSNTLFGEKLQAVLEGRK